MAARALRSVRPTISIGAPGLVRVDVLVAVAMIVVVIVVVIVAMMMLVAVDTVGIGNWLG